MFPEWIEFLKVDTRPSASDFADDVWDGENCCSYSSDGTKLLDAEVFPDEVHILEGTKIICDGVFAFQDYMAEDRALGEKIPEDERVSVLDKVFIPSTVSHIGREAFRECGWLRSIKLPKDLLVIGEEAFACCWELRGISCPAPLAAIGDGAFDNCVSLSNVRLNKSLKAIGSGAFFACESVEEILLPSSLEFIGDEAFEGTRLKRIFVAPSGRERIMDMLPDKLRKKVRSV
jgi:hypothetical protein